MVTLLLLLCHRIRDAHTGERHGTITTGRTRTILLVVWRSIIVLWCCHGRIGIGIRIWIARTRTIVLRLVRHTGRCRRRSVLQIRKVRTVEIIVLWCRHLDLDGFMVREKVIRERTPRLVFPPALILHSRRVCRSRDTALFLFALTAQKLRSITGEMYAMVLVEIHLYVNKRCGKEASPR